MQGLIRFYNQNRKDIWKVILIIAIIIGGLQLLNYMAKQKNKKQQNIVSNTNAASIQYNNVNLETEKSALSGDKLSNTQKDTVKVIDDFFSYCNEQKLQEAYDLLTEECKEEMYSSVQAFEEMYYKKVLNGEEKNISVENWTDDIYKVKINEDFLTTGKYSTENTIQDYMTIKKDDDDKYKININGYIGRTTPNKEKEYENINVKVMQKNMYMNYTIYTFEVTNNSEKTILLDSLKNIDDLYIKDNNGIKYSAYTHELSQGQLVINSGETKQIKIKYYSKYSSTKKIKSIVFSRMILDYDKYLNFENKNYYNNFYTFEIGV